MAYQSKTLWISYSGLSDFEACPRAYYLKNLYFTPVTRRKIQVANPFLTLGMVVHRVTEEAASLPLEKRNEASLQDRFERIWEFFSGKRGGFNSEREEEEFYERGRKMIERFEDSEIISLPSLPPSNNLPKVKLFKDQDIVLVGGVDWVEVLPSGGGLHIIDFKTGKKKEEKESLQLPIYLILGTYNFDKPVEKLSYWYLEKDEGPVEQELKPHQSYVPFIQQKAMAIKKAIDENALICVSASGPCKRCEPYERIIAGEAEYAGFDRKMGREIYYVENSKSQIPNSN